MTHIALVDLNEKFDNLKSPPIIANSIPLESEDDKKALNELVYTRYDGDSLKLTPSCECGALTAAFNIGKICSQCNTECKRRYSGETDSLLWVLPGHDMPGYILPAIWLQMSNKFRDKQVDVIKYFCDPYYRLPNKNHVPEAIKRFHEAGHKRGYTYFINHMRELIDLICLRKNGKLYPKWFYIYNLLTQNIDKLVVKALPVPSKTVMVLERSGNARYFDKNLYPAIDAVIMASEMGQLPPDTHRAKIESKMVAIIEKFALFFHNFTRNLLTGKTGIFRKHYYASRMHFAARQVITSNHEPHKADELVIPWTAAVKLFTEHLRSKLMKPPHDYNFNQINEIIRYATTHYVPLIDELLKEIILVDTPYKGFPCLFSRPPILSRGSIQFFYITDFIRDPDINVVKISPLVLVMPNADFDGDAMHLTLLLDKKMHDGFKVLSPAYTILNMDKPNTLSGAIKMPPPVIGTINNWFNETDVLLEQYED